MSNPNSEIENMDWSEWAEFIKDVTPKQEK